MLFYAWIRVRKKVNTLLDVYRARQPSRSCPLSTMTSATDVIAKLSAATASTPKSVVPQSYPACNVAPPNQNNQSAATIFSNDS